MKILWVEAKKFGFDPLLVAAVIQKESKFKNSLCYHGSHGLMQIQLGVKSCKDTMVQARAQGLYDPRTNIRRGLKLMLYWKNWWKKHHSQDGYHWLLFYNQGFGKCPSGKRRCFFHERNPVTTGKVGRYADRVLRIYEELKLFGSGV
jgi:hypothetical protein